jgi:hypothetical protein
VGPVPIMRPKDHLGQKVDNAASFQRLIEVKKPISGLIIRDWNRVMLLHCFQKEFHDIILKLRH